MSLSALVSDVSPALIAALCESEPDCSVAVALPRYRSTDKLSSPSISEAQSVDKLSYQWAAVMRQDGRRFAFPAPRSLCRRSKCSRKYAVLTLFRG